MSNFRYSKIIAGVGPILAKETILSKITNMVDVFRISLSEGFDDNNKKYIDTILKLDNSKTIMLETRGNDIRVKNISNIPLKKGQKIKVEYSEYAQENSSIIYIDYPYLGNLKKGTNIIFEQSDILLKVIDSKEDYSNCEVVDGGTLLQYDRIYFENYKMDIPFLVDRDKKDIMWGLEYGIHLIAASYVKTKEDIINLKDFLDSQNAGKIKVFSKIETIEAIDNLDSIIHVSDGIIFVFDKIQDYLKQKNIKIEDIIKKCKEKAKAVFVTYVWGVNSKNYQLLQTENIKLFCSMGVDGYMIEPMINEDAPLKIITQLHEELEKSNAVDKIFNFDHFYKNDENIVRDYIINNAYRITQDLDIKAIVCYSESGYSISRLSSLLPHVPIIAFTKSDETYRYLNGVYGVKSYKISQSFNYENLKRIGKEMIRIIFKGNISLDDKIIIVQANEDLSDEKTDMINGLELYKFKNI